jgi:DtxR family Mn-dependent transcriptional regulator
MILSHSEENYLKALLKLGYDNNTLEVGTNELAALLSVKPSTATEMLKKLKEKQLVDYEKYGKIHLTELGQKRGMDVLRKHRLWETFLHEKLFFSWDEVHEIAEQLEHIQSETLVDRLDQFLEFPQFDPHGDPIPNKLGELPVQYTKKLSDIAIGDCCTMVGVKDNSSAFLQYVNQVGLSIHHSIRVVSKQAYDDLLLIEVKGVQSSVSQKFAENIFVV